MNEKAKQAVKRAASDQAKFEKALVKYKKTGNAEGLKNAKNRLDKNSIRSRDGN